MHSSSKDSNPLAQSSECNPELRPDSPKLIYGTAWKALETSKLVLEAIHAGFRAFDTAAQPKHYREELCGDAIRSAIKAKLLTRSDVHIQTKFTSILGQDPMDVPYDASASLTDQVTASVNGSLARLSPGPDPEDGTNESYLDCLLLHAPFGTVNQTLEAWNAMSRFVPHPVRALGISNVGWSTFNLLYPHMIVKPKVIQNAFHVGREFDRKLRKFCHEQGIMYQGFWILKKNSIILASDAIQDCAQKVEVNPEAALYGLLQCLGVTILDGTTDPEHMRSDILHIKKMNAFCEEGANASLVKQWLGKLEQLMDDALE